MVKNYHNSDVNKMNKIRQAGYRWSVHPSHGLSFLREQVREYKSGLGTNASVDGPNIWNFYIFDRPLFDFRTSHCNFKSFGPSSLIHDRLLSVVKSVLFILINRPLWPLIKMCCFRLRNEPCELRIYFFQCYKLYPVQYFWQKAPGNQKYFSFLSY